MTTLLCWLLVPWVVQARAGDEWMLFSSPARGFSVQMPGKPREEKRTLKGPKGGVEVILFLSEVKKGGTLAITYSEIPAVPKELALEARLDKAAKDVVALSKGKLVREKNIKLDGHPGRELLIEVDANKTIRTRLFAHPRRFYEILVVGTRDWVASPDADRFLDSFALTK